MLGTATNAEDCRQCWGQPPMLKIAANAGDRCWGLPPMLGIAANAGNCRQS